MLFQYRLGNFLLAAVMLIISGCASGARSMLYAAPSVLPHTTPAMSTPGFWINQQPNPDGAILSSQDIDRMSQEIYAPSAWHLVVSGEGLRIKLEETISDLQSKALVFLNGKRPLAQYWLMARQVINIPAIPSQIPRQYGFIVRYSDQRFLPLEEGLYAKANDIDFDELQNSALDIATQVVILHHSNDGQWLFVKSLSSIGWVKSENVAMATDFLAQSFFSSDFIVVTAPKADVYLNSAMTDFAGFIQMGARLPLKSSFEDCVEVSIPQRQPDGTAALVSGFIPFEQTHKGYLSYTPRNILIQAFKMLHQPYGWGGMYGAQDCSRFLQQVFSTVGINLPRDSKDQIKTGQPLRLGSGQVLADWDPSVNDAEKLRVIKDSAVSGISLLGMKGHILLYLGMVDDRVYAIHDVWAYRKPGFRGDDIFVIGRVVVSDLTLGEGSRRGSLLDRLNAVRIGK